MKKESTVIIKWEEKANEDKEKMACLYGEGSYERIIIVGPPL